MLLLTTARALRTMATTSTNINFNVQNIAVIGAGPSGLAALKYLSAENKFKRIIAFEQRSAAGGLWNYTPEDTEDGSFAVPKTRPTRDDLEKPIWRDGKGNNPQFLSPVYDLLETNIPKQLMRFSDLEMPEESQLFPKHPTIKDYLARYAEDVNHLVEFETQVLDVRLLDSKVDAGALKEQWSVKTKGVVTGEEKEEIFDAVVVANGHFFVPFIPDSPGIKEWHEKYPGSITHSKFYRNPEAFKDKKVIVVGNSASGIDIGTQVAAQCQLPLINSIKSASYLSPGPVPSFKKEVPAIKQLDPSTRTAIFEDGSSEASIDSIIFCTGYFYSLPFLSSVSPPLVTDGTRVQNTYQHSFYAPHPTLSFIVLNQRIIPFPTSEVQSAVIARAYAGRLELPPYAQMRAWEQHTLAVNGDGNDFHTLAFPRDADYINAMHDWAMTAQGTGGKTPPKWGEWHYWCRERFPDIKKAFAQRGKAREQVRTMEELGFSFDRWKEEKVVEAQSLL
ncbi:hypothetical protein IWX49DRAFT_359940 [Phyllosticta citricarpa]|uniref:Flavin dependent monooxygenase n=2 Tax=Phyllosticta TaxID=121621 RepID=A0ABR1L8Y1_9PEZI